MNKSANEYRFLYQQDEPELICREPAALPLEYNTGNDFYGIGHVLREYARLPVGRPLPFAIEHFVPYDLLSIHERDLVDGLPLFLSTTSERAKAYEAAGMPKAVAIGFALFYAIRLYERKHGRQAAKRRGTIVFPHKSTKIIQREFNHDDFADWLLTLSEDFQPVVVNLYWADYLQGKHKVYESRGLKVVSCGHLYDHHFLLRFYDLCRQFRYACGNSFASSLPLSVLSGCQFFYKDTFGHIERFEDKVTEFKSDPTVHSPLAQEALALSPYPPLADGFRKQQIFALKLAGHRHLRFAWTLRRLYRQAHRLLISNRGTGLDLSKGVHRSQFHAWLPEGIYLDGWLQSKFSIMIPPKGDHASLELVIEFPGWCGLPSQQFDVTAGKIKLGRVNLLPGFHRLNVSLPKMTGNQRISVRAKHSFFMSETDSRSISARLLSFHMSTSRLPEETPLVVQPVVG